MKEENEISMGFRSRLGFKSQFCPETLEKLYNVSRPHLSLLKNGAIFMSTLNEKVTQNIQIE